MRYGLMADPHGTIDEMVAAVADAERRGFDSVWLSQIFGLDALTAIAVAGREVPRIEIGTAVVPTYPRHPMVLAGQALTVQSAIGNRMALGIGLSHQIVIEGMWGYSFDKPARHMREYLSALLPLLRGEAIAYEGETLKAMGQLGVTNTTAPPVLLAALAPVMLQLAGGVADGTVTWMTGPDTLGNHIVPKITAAAEKAGKPAPRVGVGLPVCLTSNPDGAREMAAQVFSIYGQLPSYRAMLDKEGAAGPADVAIVGDEAALEAGIKSVESAGATDFVGAVFGADDERERTIEFLAARVASA
ncbi:MAG: LLM class F420-dependent oxidoreductase [Actinobacteria bacterium]|nr:LLM class F420-dependent oxidoreductase [Actinomycetota bacterium]MBV9933516.1 LLM class F420-dependent oxidoreductase [Actinomycetota bacterium]